MRRRPRDNRQGNIVAGAILLTLGSLFLVNRMGLFEVHEIWTYWPVALIVVGLIRFFGPGGPWKFGKGLSEILSGLVFLAFFQHWGGVTWRTGWPLLLIAVGVGMIANAFVPRQPWSWDGCDDKTEPSNASVVDGEGRHG